MHKRRISFFFSVRVILLKVSGLVAQNVTRESHFSTSASVIRQLTACIRFETTATCVRKIVPFLINGLCVYAKISRK